MGETIRIEIPVEVKDKTASGVASASKKLSAFEKAYDQLNKKLSSFGQGIKAVTLDAHDTATGKITSAEDAVSAFDKLSAIAEITASDGATGVISDAGDAVAALNGESAVVEASAEDGATGVLSEVSDATASLNGTDAVVDVSVNDNATDVLNQIQDAVDNISGGAKGGAKSIGGAITAAAGFAGISIGIGNAITSFGNFEAGMSKVAAISGATGQQLDALTAKAQEMGAKTKFTATESAEAFNYMAMAGWGTDQMLAGIEPVMNLAAASGESLGTVSDIVTDALTAFGMKAEDTAHFADILAAAAANSNTNVAMLGESFKYAAPVAGTMGYSAEDTAVALGLMANAGIKASMGGTTLRRALTNLASPTDTVKAAMDKYNISLKKSDGTQKTLMEVMQNLRESLGGISDETEQAAAAADLFGSNALSGMLAIVNAAPEDFNKLTRAITYCDGATDRMAATMLDNMQGSLTLLSSAAEGVQNTLGSRLAPYITELAEGLTPVMAPLGQAIDDWFDALDPDFTGMITNLTAGLKTNLTTMLASEEWQEADAIGKINLAWKSIIADPLTEWIDSDGKGLVVEAVKGMFTSAGNVLSGDGGLTDWLGTGALILTVTKVVEVLGGIGGAVDGAVAAIGNFKTSLSMGLSGIGAGGFVIAAGLAAAAIWGISAAIEHYNDLEVKANLQEHFGSLDLTPEQVEQVADFIVPQDVTVELHTANVAFAEGDTLKTQAEELLNSTAELNWKVNVTGTLPGGEGDTEGLGEQIFSNLDSFKTSVKGILEKEEYAAELAVKATISQMNPYLGPDVIKNMQSWFQQDAATLDALSSSVTKLVEDSINAGAYDVNVQAAADIIQQKMLQLASADREAENLVFERWLGKTLSGGDLTPESYAAVSDKISEHIAAQKAAEAETYDNLEMYFAKAFARGHINEEGYGYYTNLLDQSRNTADSRAISRAWGWHRDTLNATYGDELEGKTATMDRVMDSIIADKMEGMKYNYNMGYDKNLRAGAWTGFEDFDNIARLDERSYGALGEVYKSMAPTVDEMRSLIDNTVGPVPQALMDAFNEAVNVGAAAGDSTALYDYMARQIAGSEGGKEAFAAELESVGVSLADDLPILNDAINRALRETTAEGDYSEIWDSVGEAIADGADPAKVQEIISQALSEHGLAMNFETGEIKAIAGEVNTEEVEQAASQAVEDAIADTSPNATVNPDAELGETSGLDESFEEYNTEAQVTYDTPAGVDATVNPDASLGTVSGLAEAYAAFASQAQAVFSTPVPVTGTVNVSTSTGEGGSNAHKANGGFINGPLLSWVGEDGPEYIIPVGGKRHDRGMELWEQAGIALGALGGFADGGYVGGKPDYSQYLGSDYAGSGQASGSTTPVTVSVSMAAPNITVTESGDGRTTAEEIRRILLGMTDQISNEVGNRLTQAFGNMPIRR